MKIRQRIEKLRIAILKFLFTKDEKYLLFRAIEDRTDNLSKISVTERWADKDQIKEDIDDYNKLSNIFSTKDYK